MIKPPVRSIALVVGSCAVLSSCLALTDPSNEAPAAGLAASAGTSSRASRVKTTYSGPIRLQALDARIQSLTALSAKDPFFYRQPSHWSGTTVPLSKAAQLARMRHLRDRLGVLGHAFRLQDECDSACTATFDNASMQIEFYIGNAMGYNPAWFDGYLTWDPQGCPFMSTVAYTKASFSGTAQDMLSFGNYPIEGAGNRPGDLCNNDGTWEWEGEWSTNDGAGPNTCLWTSVNAHGEIRWFLGIVLHWTEGGDDNGAYDDGCQLEG
jgi:hypothetical protein